MALTINPTLPIGSGIAAASLCEGVPECMQPGTELLSYPGPNGAQVKKVRIAVQGDSSYPTGGYSISLANLGLTTAILEAQVVWETDGSGGIYTGSVGNGNANGASSLSLLIKTPRSNSAGTQAQVASATSMTGYYAIVEAIGY